MSHSPFVDARLVIAGMYVIEARNWDERAVIVMWERLLRPKDAFHGAAEAIDRMLQLLADTVETGTPSATTQAMRNARALLERLHHEAA